MNLNDVRLKSGKGRCRVTCGMWLASSAPEGRIVCLRENGGLPVC